MKNKVVCITGGAGGIGFEMARQFAKDGASVVIIDISEESLNNAVSTLRTEQLDVTAIPCDVTVEDQIKKSLDTVIEKFGRIDILVNNAGLQYISPIEELPTEKFELLIKVMLVAPFIFTKYILAHMKQQNFGRVINMASINGLVGFAGKAAYNSAKHGLIGLTKVTALETAAFNITANAVCPGYVDTPLVQNQLQSLAATRNVPLEKVLEEVIFPLVPQKRLLTVNEVAAYVLFLCSENARGITGQAVVIDGGYTVQ
jgi:3-hydroxybutyrate dehydrogenase